MGSSPIGLFLPSVSTPGGDNSNDQLALPVTVAHHQNLDPEAHPQQNEAVLVFGVFRVVVYRRALVAEGRLSLLERDAVLPLIRLVLALVPNEPEVALMYSVRIA